MGILLEGIFSHYMGDWLGYLRIREYSVQFTDLVWTGKTLICHGEVHRYERQKEIMVDCDLEVTNEAGETKISGRSQSAAKTSWSFPRDGL